MNSPAESNPRLVWIRERLHTAELRVRQARRTHLVSLWASLGASALATALAGYAAVQGSPLASWRATCGVVAGMTLVSTIAAGLQKQLDLNARLAKSNACIGRLRAVEYAVAIGGQTGEAVDRECQAIVAEYADVVGS